MSKQGSLSDRDKKLKLFGEAKKNRGLSSRFLKDTGRDLNAFILARWDSDYNPNSTEFEELKNEFEIWKKDKL